MEEIDTKKMRQKYQKIVKRFGVKERSFFPAGGRDIYALCDALDACREERNEARAELEEERKGGQR